MALSLDLPCALLARSTSGRKMGAWTLFYRFGGKQRRSTFEGGYPALDLKKARQKATEAQLLIQQGWSGSCRRAGRR